jgi:hypothetical protein
MAEKLPFDDDVMTLIMGLGGPDKPGQHGRTIAPAPENKAIDVITQIRDLCEEFLQTADKGEEDKKQTEDTKPNEEEPDMEE